MKTIEEKAMAYDEAIERAKVYWETDNDNTLDIKARGTMEHLFPELAESEDERIRKRILFSLQKDIMATKNSGCDTKDLEECIAWLEKQGEKPTEKVKPKFHEGDWAVSNLDGKARQISEVHFDEYNSYYVVNGKSVNLEEYDRLHHLWTIQDAKDGDVLVNGSNIFIFHFLNDTRLMGYCHVNTDDGRFYDDIGKNECFCLIDAIVNPATKEQRDLLFQKMHEAGYEWNANKKELKKIELKPMLSDFFNAEYERGKADALKSAEWSDEDEYMLNETIQHLEELIRIDKAKHLGCDVQYYQRDIDWLKLLKNRVYPKQEWSEEDKERYISCLQRLGTGNPDQPETINSKWFKEHVTSLPQWKPNKKQMHFLNWLANVKLGDSVVEQEVSKNLNELYNDLTKL